MADMIDRDIADALADSAYLAGAQRGYQLGYENDIAGYLALHASRDGYLKPITEKRRKAQAE